MFKKTISKLLVVVMVFSLMVTVTSCGKIKEKVGEKVAEKATEKLLGDNVDIKDGGIEVKGEDGGSFQAGEKLDWPKDAMGDIPELKGNIISQWSDDKNCQVMFQDMDQKDVEDYIEEIKDMGFKDALQLNDEDMFMYSGTREDKADTISITYSKSDQSASITYNQEQTEE